MPAAEERFERELGEFVVEGKEELGCTTARLGKDGQGGA